MNFSSIIVRAAPHLSLSDKRLAPEGFHDRGLNGDDRSKPRDLKRNVWQFSLITRCRSSATPFRYFGLYFDSDFDFGGRQCRQVLRYFLADLPHIATCAIRVDLDDIEEVTR
jgi:hypothetical protein